MDQLSQVRKLAAERYLNKKDEVIPPEVKKSPFPPIEVITRIYQKNPSGYYIHVNGKTSKIEDLIYEHPFCSLGLGKNKPLSEFGKSINSGYIKTLDNHIFRINDKTFFLPFIQLSS